MMRHRRSGFTIAEVTVYSAVALVALTAIYAVLITSLRYFNTTNYSAELQQNAMQILSRLTVDAAESDAESVQRSSFPQGISFASPRDLNGDVTFNNGTMQWKSFISYYVSPSKPGYLYRAQVAINPTAPMVPNVTSQLSRYTVSQFVNNNMGTLQLLSTNVTEFRLTLTGNSLAVNLKLDKLDASGNIIKTDSNTPQNELIITASGVLLRN